MGVALACFFEQSRSGLQARDDRTAFRQHAAESPLTAADVQNPQALHVAAEFEHDRIQQVCAVGVPFIHEAYPSLRRPVPAPAWVISHGSSISRTGHLLLSPGPPKRIIRANGCGYEGCQLKRALVYGALLIILAAGTGALLFNLFKATRVDVARVTRGPAVATVYATGFVEAKERRSLKPSRAGIVDRILVSEGSEVKAGSLLVVMRDSALQARQQAAQAQVQALREKLAPDSSYRKSWEARIAELSRTAQQARERAERLKKQLGAGGVSRDDFDEAEARAVAAEERLVTMRRDAEQTLSDLASSLSVAQADLDVVAAQERDNRVLSPIDGVVLAVHVEEGEFAGLDRELVKVGDLRQLIIEGEVNEDDISGVRVGAEVLTRLAGYDETLVKGRVYEILPDALRATKSYLVRCSFVDAEFVPAGELKLAGRTRIHDDIEPFSGMTAELGIVTRRVESTLVVPRTALTVNGSVFVVDGATVREVKVTTGVQNFNVVEAKSGLNEGDVVAVSEVANLKDGARVIPRQ
ncbi:HlyD family efflux transporter periplasmic adaptor subunit [bacterium]|nr:MAG: HlyD family efflux transporter periplasmic adaptor subunit [bacterium]RIK65319.1 MAG: hypothetical protein DCC64_01385 [Planctomycetota bacterium]